MITIVDRFEIRTSTAIVAPPITPIVPFPSMSPRENWKDWLPPGTPVMVKFPEPSVTAAWPDWTARTVTPDSALPAVPASPLTTVPITVAVPGAVGEEGDSESLQLPTKRTKRSKPAERTTASVRWTTIPSSVTYGSEDSGLPRPEVVGEGNRETFEPSVRDSCNAACHGPHGAGGPRLQLRSGGKGVTGEVPVAQPGAGLAARTEPE